MTAIKQLVLLVLTSLLLLAVPAMTYTTQARSQIMSTYHDGSEMSVRIIEDFLVSAECSRECPKGNKESLEMIFEVFRERWVDKMITFVLEEL